MNAIDPDSKNWATELSVNYFTPGIFYPNPPAINLYRV